MPGSDEDGDGGGNGDDDGGLRFTLPPIRLPDRAFPSDLRVELPPPGRARRLGLPARTVVVLALAADLVDAYLALAGLGPALDWGRVVAGVGLAALLSGVTGTLYAWEAVAMAVGAGPVTVVPTLTLLVLGGARRE